MSNPQQPGQFPPPQGGPNQPFQQGPGTPPGGQPYPQQGPGTPPGGQPYPQQGPGTPPGGQAYPQGPGTPPGGQQLPPQPGYGQAPPPPHGQQPVGFPAAPPQVDPPAKRGSGKKIFRIVVLLVAVVGIGIAAFAYFTKSAATASVGDCIKVNKDTSDDADVEKIDCASQEAVFKVGKKLDSGAATCPSESDYLEYEESSRRGNSGGFSLCLVLNVKKGDCLSDLDSPAKTKKIACGTHQIEILDVVDGKVDEAACGEDANLNFKYDEPKLTICTKASA
ncbi:LppU/SCO3897 family protein [Actinokineospora globicatena]|uniref:Uncharacterized protein n=1 Tax=Actinokineospora globicatena TaxID=103729 RepID=A0A9W6V7P7_9PSEU|nr:hypothetical protein [Actinokineospora globicatena]MCP2300800.1 hypothetical protein [Actinokineospora globicatena]GLW77575.1 hypothetical protein Aglo01_20570 [Actinokineospora globicatena]GLW84409.1 hypothetical protein Aglo02_20490 [Actinokineospora globicatena]GLW93005.1 hypothetical protein Aglo03_38210 [Actinokineospora globicatena]